jgi:alpha-tubulin suppressor-like RCC1 family protein
VVVAASGECYAFGANKSGQLGTGVVRNKPKEDDVALSPAKCAVAGVAAVAAGAEFTCWVRGGGKLRAGAARRLTLF